MLADARGYGLAESEAEIWETIAGLRGKTTVVAISHQPALIAVADRVHRVGGRTATLDPGGSDSDRAVA